MILCYNLTRQQPVDLDNCRINTKPLLFFGERPMWELHFFQGEPGTAGTVADLSNVVSLRAAVDTDWNGNTVPMCRTVDGIDKSRAAEGVIGVPLDANTARYLEKLDNRKSVDAVFELRGFDDTGAAVLIVQIDVTCRGAVDPEGGEVPAEPDSDLASKSWTKGVLAQKLIFEYSIDGATDWHRVCANHIDQFQRVKHGTDGTWSDPQPIPYGEDGLAVVPDATGSLADRPESAEDGSCFVSTEGKVYWFIGEAWTEGVPLTTVPGPEGKQGPAGEQGPQGKQGPEGKQGIQGLKGDDGKQGPQGIQGEPGDGLAIDATGTLANRHNYDAADRGFRYMATDLYCESITVRESGTVFARLESSDNGTKAYAWTDGETTVYTELSCPSLLNVLYSDKDLKTELDKIVATAQKYQLYYQKTAVDLGAWSAGIRLYCGPEGPVGPIGPEGKQGSQGENAAVFSPVEFGTGKEGALEIIANAVMLTGVKPIATVELYFDDPADPGEVKTLDVTHRVTIHYCDTDNKTHVYFTDQTLDLSRGGRIRFAQGVSGMTQYQEYLNNGGTLDYNSWISAVQNTMEEAPQDGNFYCRRNGRWVAVAVVALSDVSISGTQKYERMLSVGAPFSLTFDALASNGADVEVALTSGTLPDGLVLNGKTLSGTPTSEGSAELTFTASATGVTMEITVSLTITAAKTMYYGWMMSTNEIYKVTDITADMLTASTVTIAAAAPMNKTSLGDAPAAAMVFVLLPKSSGLKALKFDGIGGYLEFEENNGGISGTGANGTEITLNGTAYLVYGEIRLVTGETFVKVETV